MKNIFARFVPNFLRRLDYYFLLNHRLIWITKIHYVLFYALVAIGLTALTINIMPFDKGSFWHPFVWTIILAIVSLIPFGFWVYQQISFNIEKNYGKHSLSMAYAQWVLQFSVIAIFIILPIIGGVLGEKRVANLAQSADLLQDANILNQGNPYFPTTLYQDNVHQHKETGSRNYYVYDFRRFTDYRIHEIDKTEILLNYQQLYDQYHKNHHDKNAQFERIRRFIFVFNQYGGAITKEPELVWEAFQKSARCDGHIENKFLNLIAQKHLVISNISTIAEAKGGKIFPLYDSSFILFLTILAFMSSIFLTVFQQSQIRDFIIAMLSGIAILMTLGLMSFVSDKILGLNLGVRSDGNFFIYGMLAYIFFAYKTYSIFQSETYSRLQTVSMIMVAIISPFLLAGICATSISFSMSPIMEFEESMWLGLGVYTVILMPFFKMLLTRVQALPKG